MPTLCDKITIVLDGQEVFVVFSDADMDATVFRLSSWSVHMGTYTFHCANGVEIKVPENAIALEWKL